VKKRPVQKRNAEAITGELAMATEALQWTADNLDRGGFPVGRYRVRLCLENRTVKELLDGTTRNKLLSVHLRKVRKAAAVFESVTYGIDWS
jgi:hypothetical protein